MTYVPRYPGTKQMAEPKSAIGFVRRLEMLDRRIASATNQRSRVIYRMTRSVTLLQAERRLGNVRFLEICSKLGISTEPTAMDRHRKISAKAYSLFDVAQHLPNDDESLCLVTEIAGLGMLIYGGILHPYRSLDDLRKIVRYSKAAFAFDEIRRRTYRTSRQTTFI